MLKKVAIFLILIVFPASAENLKKCEWDNRKGLPCLTISKTPNSSAYSEKGINKITITKQDIINSGAVDSNDVLKLRHKTCFIDTIIAHEDIDKES